MLGTGPALSPGDAWLDGLADDEFGHVERYIDLLADQGALLGEPFTRQLDGKLRELRFYLRPTTDPHHLLHRHRTDQRRCTVFAKTRPRERTEIDRARRAMQCCIDDGHIAIEEGSP